MKASELAIGDWVQGFLPDTNSKVVGILNDVQIAIVGGGTYIELDVDDLQPIPLTSEILEKNGFKKGKYCYEFKERLYGYMGQTVSATTPIEINYYEEGHCVVMNPHIGRDFQGSISYVHELQHAMKLCEIGKEIEL